MIVNLFSGAGGWEEGARPLGLASEIVGIELAPDAAATARAAGHEVIVGSVAERIPADLRLDGLIASPPCQAFSAAGRRLGRNDIPIIYEALDWIDANADRAHEPLPASFAERCTDPRSILVVEPWRWILATRPRWVAAEQVPAVLPLWEWMRDGLDVLGCSAWAGKLHAEEYGVPQTRQRAILIASCEHPVAAPPPTHAGFDPRRKAPKRGHEERPRYVTMAEALGWGMTERPYPTVASSRTTGGPDREKVGGSAARAALYAEQEAGRWKMIQSARSKATVRASDEPAFAITAGHDSGERRIVGWPAERPATTIAGDPRVHPPGHKVNAADRAAGRDHYEGRAGKNAIRVSIGQAAILQSFRADYPWKGTKTEQFRGVGNAIPPLLATHVLSEATGILPS